MFFDNNADNPNEAAADDNLDGCPDRGCERITHKMFEVLVPVTVRPFALPERPRIRCEGEAEVYPGHRECEECVYEFTIAQRVNVEIPVRFGAEVCCERPCADMPE
jgi:hypothetical protein